MPQIMTPIMVVFLFFILGIIVGHTAKKSKLEQKLCQAKHYEYCNNKELLNYIKK